MDSHQPPAAAATAPVVAQSGDHNTQHNNINIHINVPPSESQHELAAIVKTLMSNPEGLAQAVNNNNVRAFLMWVFEEANVQCPPELRSGIPMTKYAVKKRKEHFSQCKPNV